MGTLGKIWNSFAIGTVALLAVAASVWIADHPIGTNWDESMYFNQIVSDTARIKSARGLAPKSWALAAVSLGHDRVRPPAFRLLALPFTYAFGFSPTMVR